MNLNSTNDLEHQALKPRALAAACYGAILGVALWAGGAIAAEPLAKLPEPAPKIEQIDIDGRTLRFLTQGAGSPAIVIEAGMGGAGVDYPAWRAIIGTLSRTHQVVAYDRAGLGKSDPATKFPRTSQDVAKDLDLLLTKTGVSGPYLLVGHSYGGMHAQVFARQYPDKVAGLVLVDSAHPDQDPKWIEALGPATPGEHESVRRGREFLTGRSKPESNPEQIDVVASGAQSRGLRLPGKPVVILTHSSKFRLDPNLPEEVSIALEKVVSDLQREFKAISTNHVLMQSLNGGHALHNEDPELVLTGIRQALEAVKNRTQLKGNK